MWRLRCLANRGASPAITLILAARVRNKQSASDLIRRTLYLFEFNMQIVKYRPVRRVQRPEKSFRWSLYAVNVQVPFTPNSLSKLRGGLLEAYQ